MKKIMKNNMNQKGFTIIELMIATVIFSIVLLVLTENIISISNDYYQGVVQTQTINTTKNIVDTIAQQIKLSTSTDLLNFSPPMNTTWNNTGIIPITNFEGILCVGNNEYVFQNKGYVVNGTSYISGSSPHSQATGALELYYNSSCSSSDTSHWNFNSGSLYSPGPIQYTSLVPQNMRLQKFVITAPVPGFITLYKIDVEVAYGNDDSFDAVNNKCKAGHYLCAHTEIVSYVSKNN